MAASARLRTTASSLSVSTSQRTRAVGRLAAGPLAARPLASGPPASGTSAPRRSCTSRSYTPGNWSRPTGGRPRSAAIEVRVRWRRLASVPDSTTRPARMIVTRSQSASTSDRMWLDSRTVRPLWRSSSMHSRNTASISGSSPDVGSSRISSSTSEASAEISATFCRLPLEYARAFLAGSRSNRSSRLARRLASRPPRSRPSRSITSPPVKFGHKVTSPGT